MDKNLIQTSSAGEQVERGGSHDAPIGVSSRRQFSKRAAIGGAVFFSLANRPVWSQGVSQECASLRIINSVTATSHHSDQEISDAHERLSEVSKLINEDGWEVVVDTPNEICAAPPP